MLIRFNVTNFLSFDKETEFNMLASTSLKTHKEHVYEIKRGLNVLKASAIYGANGAGKSNLIKAISTLRDMVEKGKVPAAISRKKYRFKSENEKLPVTYEIEFSKDKKIYTYGVSFDNNIVLEEWLYQTGGSTGKLIFERNSSKDRKTSVIKVADKYRKSDKSKLLISLMEENLLKPNELFLSKNESLKYKEIDEVVRWITKGLVIIFPNAKARDIVPRLYHDKGFKKFSNELLESFNTGIDTLDFESKDFDSFIAESYPKELKLDENDINEIKSELDTGEAIGFVIDNSVLAIKEKDKYLVKIVIAKHRNIPFEIKEESDGTQRLIDFLPLFNGLLKEEATFIIDEIDRSLHPSILHTIIGKVMDDNTVKGQLVFTTHESSLLTTKMFRTDEIWFAEKNKETQATELYTLNEFKPRNDLDIEKGYLNGRFGAIPFLSKLQDLNWHEHGV